MRSPFPLSGLFGAVFGVYNIEEVESGNIRMNNGTMNLCPYCFRQLYPGEKCGCGYELSSQFRIKEALRPGMIVGACYQIGGVLGRGGFAITYRGYDLDLEKVVAVKEFFPEGMVVRNPGGEGGSGRGSKTCEILASGPKNADVYRKSLNLFYREARALGRLGNLPNVVHVYRIFRENNTAYIVMDYVEGKPLRTIIRERSRIPEEELLPLLDPILSALQKVHEAGILHRDIAPDNIIIDEKGQPVLLDFGAARIDSGSQSSLVIGKKSFSSPEQIGGGLQDERSDVYSLGTTYYFALSGVKPQDAVMRAIEDQVVPLKDLIPDVSERVSDAVMTAMAVKPDERWTNVRAFQTALSDRYDADGPEAHTAETPVSEPEANPAIDAASSENEPEQTAALTQPLTEPDPRETVPRIRWKRKYGLILLVLLVISGLLFGVLHYRETNDHTGTPVPSRTGEPDASRFEVGMPYYFGRYEQDNEPENGSEEIKWRILASEEDRVLLISEYALDMTDFNFKRDIKISWENCDLRKWLNQDFYNSAFNQDEKDRILESLVQNSGRSSDSTYDRLFLLSYDEAGEYFKTDADRQCRATAYAQSSGADVFDLSGKTRWWLRSGNEDPDSTERWAAIVWAYGSREYISDINTITGIAVRPAMWIYMK